MYCQREIEGHKECRFSCEHCNEYYSPLRILTGEVLKTSEEWYKGYTERTGITILDPDGWDRKNYEFSWYRELLTQEEFAGRVMFSTVRRTKKDL